MIDPQWTTEDQEEARNRIESTKKYLKKIDDELTRISVFEFSIWSYIDNIEKEEKIYKDQNMRDDEKKNKLNEIKNSKKSCETYINNYKNIVDSYNY